ncbi:MAG: hypothetical protein ACRDL2_15075 [Gaiellaceae bacterium]
MKQLTIIATIFSISRLTGFFGRNFGFEVRHITGWDAFSRLGLGTEVLGLPLLLDCFKRRGQV